MSRKEQAHRGWHWDSANSRLSVMVDGVEAGYFTTSGAYITVAGTGEVTFGSDATYPTTSDSNALGTTTYMWSDLFLASGGVINFNAGDVTLTHSANALAFAGGCFNMHTSGSPYTYTAGTPAFTLYATAAGSGSTNCEPMYVKSTVTGTSPVGGRSRFHCSCGVAAGQWLNALKAYMEFGAAGSVTGLGSALCAETVLSAGTTSGTYAALEAELVAASGAQTGTATSFLYCNCSDASGKVNDNGFFLELGAGLTSSSAHLWYDNTSNAADEFIRCKTPSGTRYLILSDSTTFS